MTAQNPSLELTVWNPRSLLASACTAYAAASMRAIAREAMVRFLTMTWVVQLSFLMLCSPNFATLDNQTGGVV